MTQSCREYQGLTNEKGYGVRYGGAEHRWGSRYVHRQIWAMVNGPIPKGQLVLHRCDNPPCFRYDHLFLGTPADNSADMVAKRRKIGIGGRPGPRLVCKRGHDITERNGRRRCYVCKAEYDARYQREHPR